MAKQFSRMILIFLMLTVAAGTAVAEEAVLPVGTQIQLPNGTRIQVETATHFLVERTSIDRANASRAAEIRLNESLKDCRNDLLIETEPKHTSKLTYIATGAAVASAFFLGLSL